MDLEYYHEFTKSTAKYPESGTGSLNELAYLSLGLAGETGEAVDTIKKSFRVQELTDHDIECLKEELGDVLYYWTRLCYAAGLHPEEVKQANVDKLTQRLETGTLTRRNTDS